VAAWGGEEAGVADDGDEPAAGAQNPPGGHNGRVQVGDVHEPELAGHAIDGTVGERGQAGGVIDDVAHGRGWIGALAGQVDHRLGGVDAGNRGGASLDEGSGGEALPARHVEHSGAGQVR